MEGDYRHRHTDASKQPIARSRSCARCGKSCSPKHREVESHIIKVWDLCFQHTILSTDGRSGRKARSTRNPDDYPESAVLPLDDGAIIKSRRSLRNFVHSVNVSCLTPASLWSVYVRNPVNTSRSRVLQGVRWFVVFISRYWSPAT